MNLLSTWFRGLWPRIGTLLLLMGYHIRGLKQGNAISLTLFIIGVEFLSRKMNNLNDSAFFNGSYMEKKRPQMNHLNFVDDIYHLLLLRDGNSSCYHDSWTLSTYKEKSQDRKSTRIIYFCPLCIGKRRIIYFSKIVSKVSRRIGGWKTKMLSQDRIATLIKHVLHAMTIHLLLYLFLKRIKK